MTENKNKELDDETMAKVAGGVGEENAPEPKYSAGSKVTMTDDPEVGTCTIVSIDDYYSPRDGWLYIIKPDSGAFDSTQYFEVFLMPA